MNLERALHHMRVDGFHVIEGVIPSGAVEGVRRSVEATVATHASPDAPVGIGFVPGLTRHDQSFAPYLAEPRLMTLAAPADLDDVGDHQLPRQ